MAVPPLRNDPRDRPSRGFPALETFSEIYANRLLLYLRNPGQKALRTDFQAVQRIFAKDTGLLIIYRIFYIVNPNIGNNSTLNCCDNNHPHFIKSMI